jgi:hypothetical protein
MVTDPIPRSAAKRAEYDRSDRMTSLALPGDGRLREVAIGIESALSFESKARLQDACKEWLAEAAIFYDVPRPSIRVLAARPLRVHEMEISQLFGDYQLGTALIRVWMRTAVQKRVTSSGTFLNTLCHEFCHHLDLLRLGLPSSFHTRGFYSRTATLYHYCRGTPSVPLVWHRISNNRWQIDWRQMRWIRTRIH